MPGKTPRVNPLDSRKQLLIAESELNRAQLSAEVTVMTAGVRTHLKNARSYGVIASSAAALVSGLAACPRRAPDDAGAKTSWLQRVIKGAGLASNLWLAFRGRSHRPPEN
jgi:hypothetical protein